MNKISINERELRQSIRKHLIEQDSEKEQKMFICPIPVLARCIWELKNKRK